MKLSNVKNKITVLTILFSVVLLAGAFNASAFSVNENELQKSTALYSQLKVIEEKEKKIEEIELQLSKAEKIKTVEGTVHRVADGAFLAGSLLAITGSATRIGVYIGNTIAGIGSSKEIPVEELRFVRRLAQPLIQYGIPLAVVGFIIKHATDADGNGSIDLTDQDKESLEKMLVQTKQDLKDLREMTMYSVTCPTCH